MTDTIQTEGATACNDRAPKNRTPRQPYTGPPPPSTEAADLELASPKDVAR